MRYFTLIDFQHVLLAFFIGLISTASVYMIWGAYSYLRNRKKEDLVSKLGHLAPVDEKTEKNPVGPFLLSLYIFVALFLLAYLVARGIYGGPVG